MDVVTIRIDTTYQTGTLDCKKGILTRYRAFILVYHMTCVLHQANTLIRKADMYSSLLPLTYIHCYLYILQLV